MLIRWANGLLFAYLDVGGDVSYSSVPQYKRALSRQQLYCLLGIID
jgi:hypothetical protein